ncbi:hypothetical protein PENTCL1PPCAC_14997, partial [Pristionchus entomophagus]
WKACGTMRIGTCSYGCFLSCGRERASNSLRMIFPNWKSRRKVNNSRINGKRNGRTHLKSLIREDAMESSRLMTSPLLSFRYSGSSNFALFSPSACEFLRISCTLLNQFFSAS